MADHELDAVAGEIVGDRDALLGIGDVVAVVDRDLLAENAAGLVDVGGGLIDAVLHLRAGGGVGPVIGPATPNLTCAAAEPASASAKRQRQARCRAW